ncbi:MAG: aspartate-semialdehyde dehydrogenase [Candidatus Altiarchaeales archaeon]|nr:aspartate-semialdehyde dehydrogenase [Candidatus Altiarchaeales archaeon]
MKKLAVGVLGATGMVGQRFIQGLEDHPYFDLVCLAASERSAGKKYREAAKWHIEGGIPESVADQRVDLLDPGLVEEYDLDLVFSSIPASVAKDVEASFASRVPTFSNTRTYRMEDDVPLIVADVNPDHLSLVEKQRERGWDGFVVTNPNCSTIGLVVPLKPLLDVFGIDWVNVTTLQGLSGAGYNGVPSMAVIDNIIPYIGGEEEKMESESLKILGSLGDKVDCSDIQVTASCNRVPVLDGHTEAVSVGLSRDFEVEEVVNAFKDYENEPQRLGLPSAPCPAILVHEEPDRPQPRRDRLAGCGMAVSCGRIMRKAERLLRFYALSHNTIRGAAGASILNAELAYKKGFLG